MTRLFNRFLKFLGDDPTREGLTGTPARVVRASRELFAGYDIDPAKYLETHFVDGACNEMVILKDICTYSTCEHHILPFTVTAHLGYIPNGKVVGISKLARLVEAYAKRLQIQERLVTQIADTMEKALDPKGVMVVLSGQHLCMMARGVKQSNTKMITSAIRGTFAQDPTAHMEFLALIGLT